MSALGARLGAILAALAIAALGYLYVDGLQARLAKAEGDVDVATKAVNDAAGTITQLRDLVQRREVAAAKLEGERNGIRSALEEREILMRKLLDENAEIRSWAAAAVPAPVARLREHGPIVGAAAYRQYMSEGAAVPAAGGKSDDKR